jgi:hypothetical protein
MEKLELPEKKELMPRSQSAERAIEAHQVCS